ncbi:MAG: hypothetical protein NT049_05340 [Planctomycetota bacterium]|nr:hypothetical protein [Planctomycetota bacterium]
MTKRRMKPKTYEAEMGGRKVRVTVPESDDASEAAPTKDGQTAAEVYVERRRDITSLLDWLGQELAKHQKQAKADPRNWGAAGDLYRVRSGLLEVVAGLRGVEVADIDRHLGGQGDDEVAKQDACPGCGERDADKLVWQGNGETVRCSTCGKQYTPPAK